MNHLIKPGIVKLLKAFYENKTRFLYFREILRITKMNQNSALIYLRLLEKEKIIFSESKANLKLYKINPKNKYAISSFILFDKEKFAFFPINVKRAIEILKRELDSYFIIVFGSYAKGTYTKSSDVDIFMCVKNKDLIKEYEIIKKISYETGVDLQVIISNLKNTTNQQHIIETGLPISNYENFYEVYYDDTKI